MSAPHPATAGGGRVPPASFPTSHISLPPGLRVFKTGSEVPRDGVTESATTCGKLITSLTQPNKRRLGEKIPEIEAVVTPKGAR